MTDHTQALAETTPLGALTGSGQLTGSGPLTAFAGMHTPAFFSSADDELAALHHSAGVYDLGWRTRLRITGEDRVRWLNGMVTNTVKDLAPGQLNYTFLLNAQGRIQGDGDVYALPDALLFATSREQAPHIMAQFDRFIIMDDVELTPDNDSTALGVAGPSAAPLLNKCGFGPLPAAGHFIENDGILLAQEMPDRYSLWFAATSLPSIWERIQAAGAVPCGMQAAEALRILSGIPRYGADIHDKSLAQETGQTRALNFNKGCYLGQEIVERIRSRATVHRALRSFSLAGAAPAPGTPLFTADKPDAPIGELTSSTSIALPGFVGIYALGTVRTEAATAPLHYAGGTAQLLPQAPLLTV